MRWEKAAALIPWFTFESGFSKKSRLPLKWGWAGDKSIFSAGYIDLGHVIRSKRNIILFKKEINTVMTHETVQQEKKVEVFQHLKTNISLKFFEFDKRIRWVLILELEELFVHIEESFFHSQSTLEAFDIRIRIIGTLKLDFPFKNNKSRISAKNPLLLCKIAVACGAACCFQDIEITS